MAISPLSASPASFQSASPSPPPEAAAAAALPAIVSASQAGADRPRRTLEGIAVVLKLSHEERQELNASFEALATLSDLVPFRDSLHLAFSGKARRLFNQLSPKINAFLKLFNPAASPEECVQIFDLENDRVRKMFFRIHLLAMTRLASYPRQTLAAIFGNEFGPAHPLIDEMIRLYKYLKKKIDLIETVIGSHPAYAAELAEYRRTLKQLATQIGISLKMVRSDAPFDPPLAPSAQRLTSEWTFRNARTSLTKSILTINRMIDECTLYLPADISFRALLEPLYAINRSSSPSEIEEVCASLQQTNPRLDQTIGIYERLLAQFSLAEGGFDATGNHFAASLAAIELLRNTCRSFLAQLERYSQLRAEAAASAVQEDDPPIQEKLPIAAPPAAHSTALASAEDFKERRSAAAQTRPRTVERTLSEEPLFHRGMSVKAVAKILTRDLGFRLVRQSGTSHAQYERESIIVDPDDEEKEERVVQRTTLSMHSKDIGPRTASELNKFASASK